MQNHKAHFALEFALNTAQSFFLTGKAGTGKTTLLKRILSETRKNTIVVAPTGVAAINAGGVTIHSMFGLPLTSFIPSNDYVDLNIANNRHSLKKHMRYRKEKRKLIQELDLLIIDEISMVRADILDAIDFILRDIRKNAAPFGGLQVIFIGDLYQLPPVVRDESWAILRDYYDSPFFFDSQVWKESNAFIVELEHIYRQQDDVFISLLNKVRNGITDEADILKLNSHFEPHIASNLEEYITLCTHNYQADEINKNELAKIDKPSFVFKAQIEGNFNENAYPADQEIHIKEGAQVMFIRNDAEDGMYFNGKLAKVVSIAQNFIKVEFLDTKEIYTLKEEIWENINYKLNTETNEVQQEKLGSFTQYPIRLAWAITVHKSQGLTFTKAILDLGKSFAAGQAYVALSRCTSLDGLILKSRLRKENIFVDPRIVAFHKEYRQESDLDRILEFAKEEYAQQQIIKAFSFYKINEDIQDWKDLISEKDLPEKHHCVSVNKEAYSAWLNLQDVEEKFKQQLKHIFRNLPKTEPDLYERCNKGIHYFTEEIFHKIITPLSKHMQEYSFKPKSKAYIKYCDEMLKSLWAHMHFLYKLHYVDTALYQAEYIHKPSELDDKSVPKVTAQKGATYEVTLSMFESGKSAEEIATERSMAVSTIEQHLSKWVVNGKINVLKLIDKERFDKIRPYLENNHAVSLGSLKEEIPFDCSYPELRYVLAHLQFVNKKS